MPCKNADTHEWLRAGPVTTLGELFMNLGTKYTAKEIYAFYRTCRLIVFKKGKVQAKPKGAPGSASASQWSSRVGVIGSALQAAAIQAEVLGSR